MTELARWVRFLLFFFFISATGKHGVRRFVLRQCAVYLPPLALPSAFLAVPLH